MNLFIRAYNKKGKSFDINPEPVPINIYSSRWIFGHIAESAKEGLQLMSALSTLHRSLNEMYLSFMDPNGEILGFTLIEVLRSKEYIIDRLFFLESPEKRELMRTGLIWLTDLFGPIEEIECDPAVDEFSLGEIEEDDFIHHEHKIFAEVEEFKLPEQFGARHIATLDSLVWPNHCIKGDNPETEHYSTIITDGVDGVENVKPKEVQQIVRHELMHLEAQIERMKQRKGKDQTIK